MKKHRKSIVAGALAVLGVMGLAACDDDPTGPDSEAEATVYVVHGINGEDLGAAAALPVDVFVSGAGCAVTGLEFRDVAGPLTLPAGTYDIRVHLAAGDPCSGDVAIQADGVGLSGGSNVSIVAHLAEGGAPTASVFANDLSAADGSAKISPRHAADFGPVDVVVDGTPVYENVPNGTAATAVLDPGTYAVAIQTPDNSTTAFEADLTLEAGTLYAAYAVGSVASGTFEVLIQTIQF